MARKRAFARWAREWHVRDRAEGYNRPFPYENTLVYPPDGKNHPLWIAANDFVFPDGPSSHTRHNTSTALRLAVGHAFTSDYSHRFRPDIPKCEHKCECGFPDRSFIHMVFACPRFTRARLRASHFSNWQSFLPTYLLSDPYGTRHFLGFLTFSRAAYKPLSVLAVPFDPG